MYQDHKRSISELFFCDVQGYAKQIFSPGHSVPASPALIGVTNDAYISLEDW
jgi:hypothetical protein